MRCLSLARPALAFGLSALTAMTAVAAGQRTFVASYGDDLNPCTLQLPCRSFAPAIAAVTAGGEVLVLDSAGYGPFTVTKSVSVIAPPGVYAGMSPTAGQDGITVAAGPGDRVVLRGLKLNGLGATHGIQVSSVGELHVADTEIAGFTGRGVNFATGGKLFLDDSIVRNNGEAGVHAQSASSLAVVSIDRSRFENNGANGVVIATNAQGAISNSVAAGNDNVGFLVDAGGKATIADCRISDVYDISVDYGILVRGSGSEATVSRCDVFGSFHAFRAEGAGALLNVSDSTAQAGGTGFTSEAGAVLNLERSTANRCQVGMRVLNASTMRVSNSTATNNSYGFLNFNVEGVFESRGNNTVRGNAVNLSGTITVIGGS